MFDGAFPVERAKYIEAAANPTIKKWYGNRDASSTTERRKWNALGKSSLNIAPEPIQYETHNTVNVVSDALRRMRSSGYVTSAKVRAKPGNGLTPSWASGPLVRSEFQSVVPIVGDPVHGQYTTMKKKGVIPPPPMMFDTGLYHRVRHRQPFVLFQAPLYH